MNICSPREVKLIINTLQDGKVVILPTDTVYGLCIIINSEEGYQRIYQIKQRSRDNPLAIIVDEVVLLEEMIEIVPIAQEYLFQYPTITLIGKIKPAWKNIVGHQQDTLGVRVTNSPWLKKIIKKTGPLYATSVNISHHPPFTQVKEFTHFAVDLIVDGGEINNSPSPIYNIITETFIR